MAANLQIPMGACPLAPRYQGWRVFAEIFASPSDVIHLGVPLSYTFHSMAK